MKTTDFENSTSPMPLEDTVITEARLLKDKAVAIVEKLNLYYPGDGNDVNYYETLRKHIQANEKLKEAHGGSVRAGKVLTDCLRIYAKQAMARPGANGGSHYDEVMAEATPKRLLDEIIKDILPGVVDSHILQEKQERGAAR